MGWWGESRSLFTILEDRDMTKFDNPSHRVFRIEECIALINFNIWQIYFFFFQFFSPGIQGAYIWLSPPVTTH
jgi:hypothetical protein